MIGELELGGPKGMTPAGDRLVRSKRAERVIVGGVGSSKTTSAAISALVHCLRSPWRPEYGEASPCFAILGPTENVIRDTSYRAFKQVCPDYLIRREWKTSGERRLLLDSGVEVLFRTWGGTFTGLTALGLWIDEAHLLEDEMRFADYSARLRDTVYKDKLLLISGLPEFGWLHEKFGPESGTTAEVIHASTYDNQYLLAPDIERIRANVPLSMQGPYLKGLWAKPINAVYYEWDPGTHLSEWPGDKQAPCHVSIDVGERAAVLFWQETQKIFRKADGVLERKDGRGLHVVDELLPERSSARQIMRLVLARGWKLFPGWSRVYVDPATDRDELASIAEAAPGVLIIKKHRGEEAYYVDEGVRCVNAALRDADGWTRLTVWRGMPRTPRSLIPSIPRLRRKEHDPAKVHKDNALDHVALDAFRYPVADLIPLKGASIRVRGAA